MIRRIQASLQRFIKIESFSGILLFGATIFALIWANSPYFHYYDWLWNHEFGFSLDKFELRKPIILWINDGLMAIFFFLIGLELKRELLMGELNSIKKASLPVIAALGGVVVPIAIYLTLNQTPYTVRGWGIPMATDIAFALAILSLLGNRVPLSLKIFLTAFAIIDDLAAVLVIALFYSASIHWMLLVYAIGIVLFLAYLSHIDKHSKSLTVVLGLIVWYLFLKSGVHPTIAGVLLAFTIPLRQKEDLNTFKKHLAALTDSITENKVNKALLSKVQIIRINELENLTRKVRSPLQHLEHKLHNLSAYFILPLFAFTNAGVRIDLNTNFDVALIRNIAISLFVGKFVGVLLFSYLGIKLKLIELPKGIKFKQIIGIAIIAGVGFTMSIFIGNLAFEGNPLEIDSAKIGIIIGSFLSGVLGYFVLLKTSKKQNGQTENN